MCKCKNLHEKEEKVMRNTLNVRLTSRNSMGDAEAWKI